MLYLCYEALVQKHCHNPGGKGKERAKDGLDGIDQGGSWGGGIFLGEGGV